MDIERVKSIVRVDDETGCWNWTMSVNSAGYGQFIKNKRHFTAHRFVYCAVNGDLPSNVVVRHLCHNKKCCNPDHLAAGSQKDNYNDSREIHLEASEKSRKMWSVNGIIYETFRDVVSKTGISSNSVNKFTVNGVFDVAAYRDACRVAGWKPKV